MYLQFLKTWVVAPSTMSILCKIQGKKLISTIKYSQRSCIAVLGIDINGPSKYSRIERSPVRILHVT